MRLAPAWGIETRMTPDIRDLEAMSGVAAGVPMGSPGAVNHLRLVHAPRR